MVLQEETTKFLSQTCNLLDTCFAIMSISKDTTFYKTKKLASAMGFTYIVGECSRSPWSSEAAILITKPKFLSAIRLAEHLIIIIAPKALEHELKEFSQYINQQNNRNGFIFVAAYPNKFFTNERIIGVWQDPSKPLSKNWRWMANRPGKRQEHVISNYLNFEKFTECLIDYFTRIEYNNFTVLSIAGELDGNPSERYNGHPSQVYKKYLKLYGRSFMKHISIDEDQGII